MRRRPIPTLAALCVLSAAAGCDDPSSPGPGGACAGALIPAPEHPVDVALLEARRMRTLQQAGGLAAHVAELSNVPEFDHPDANVYYLTGLDMEDVSIVIVEDGSGGHESILYLDPPDVAEAFVEAREVTGADRVRCAEQLQDDLDSLARGGTPVEVVYQISARMFKDELERERLARVAHISTGGLLAGMRAVEPGAFEGDVKLAVEDAFADSGAVHTAFESIVASGENALVLHYFDAADTMRAGELIVMDVGAEYARYAGDVARTLPVSGTFTPRQRELYDVVVAARQAVLDAFAAGHGPASASARMRQVYEENADLCGGVCLMPHALFHSVGLDVHDSGSIPASNVDGVVINVEPGIYLADEGIGMRLEDTVLLTGDGYVLLTAGLPTTADEVEAFMAQQPTD